MLNLFAKNDHRRKFGKRRKAWIHVETDRGGARGHLRELCFGGDESITQEDILTALKDNCNIVYGIDEVILDRVVREARRDPHKEYFAKRNLVIARESVPVPSEDASIRLKFLELLSKNVKLDYKKLRRALKSTRLEDVLSYDIRVRPVAPGELLATLSPPQQGTPGKDIYGQVTENPPEPKPAVLKAGTGVREEEGQFFAESFGYICYLNDYLHVMNPVWLTPDDSRAYYIHFPHAGFVFPQAEWVEDLLALHNIDQELPETARRQFKNRLTDGRSRRVSIRLVEGEPSHPGDDALLVSEPRQRALEDSPDTSLLAVPVSKDEVVAEVAPPSLGLPGTTLRGRSVEAEDGKEVEYRAGENVRAVSEEGERLKFIAEIDGNLNIAGTTVEVHPMLRFEGDVSPASGPVTAVSDIEITGSVLEGATVKADGNVIIRGGVEEGATVSAKGDVSVTHGIHGTRTKVIALGGVEARFVQEASVMAQQDILVGDHVRNATLRAGRNVVVRSGKGERSGSIIGGTVMAGGTLEAEIAGSASGQATTIGITTDLALEAQIKKVGKTAEFCETNVLKMLRTLDIQSLDKEEVQKLLTQTPLWRQKPIVDLIVKLKDLIEYREQTMNSFENLTAERAANMEHAEIRINNKAYADMKVTIGEAQRILTEDLEQPLFELSSEREILSRTQILEEEDLEETAATEGEPSGNG